MAKIIYDANLQIDTPQIILQKKDLSSIGTFLFSELIYKENFNAPNELSFKVFRFPDGNLNTCWEDINDYNIVYLPDYNEYFDMQVTLNDDTQTCKSVICKSLPESELANTKLYDIEINTDNDLAGNEHTPTLFYRDIPEASTSSAKDTDEYHTSLLHRILEKSNFQIGHIDDSLKHLETWYEFSFSDTNIHDALTGDIAQQYKCLFTFEIQSDGTRIVNAYDLCNTCHDCGFRGDFHDCCPECQSTDFDGAYGKYTTVFVSKDNLSSSISVSSNKDSLKNCFRVTGGDENMTAAIINSNPNGSNYIYYFSDEMYASMPDELKTAIQQYLHENHAILTEQTFTLNAQKINIYNSKVAAFIRKHFPDEKYAKKLSSPIVGYKKLSTLSYDLGDTILYLQSTMFPTVETCHETLEETLEKLTADNLSPVSVNNPSKAVLTSVDNAVKNLCKTLINTSLYEVSLENTSYTITAGSVTGKWNGIIKLTSIADETTAQTGKLTITIDGNIENYLQQSLQKKLAKSDIADKEITDIQMDFDAFKARLALYNLDYLTSLETSFKDCLTIIDSITDETVKNTYHNLYYARLTAIEDEQRTRDNQIQCIQSLCEDIHAIQNTLRTSQDFKAYLENIQSGLWHLFCSYRREESYSNSNYFSDGLDNAQLLQRAGELLDAAYAELYKAGNMQYNISSSLHNLLAIREFQPFLDDFEAGNWIHLEADEKIYPLRLLSYEISYDNTDSITVEFSTVEKTTSGLSDMQSLLSSAASIAGNYSALTKQVKNQGKSTAYVDAWVNKGLSATQTKFVNDEAEQEIIIDQHGILCHAYDDIQEAYDPHQVKLNRYGLYTTADAWETIDTGIGKFTYYDPDYNFRKTEGYGIIAKTVVGSLILGENLGIYNSNGGLTFTENGLEITSTKNKNTMLCIQPNENNIIEIEKGSEKVFYVTAGGNGYFKGNVTANSGTIGGWTINQDSLSYQNESDSNYMLLKPSTNTILTASSSSRSLLTNGALKFERDINGQNIGYARFNSTFWTTKPNISGVGINSETASKFISFGNKNADTDDFYATVLLLNYGLNPYIDNANPALGEYTEDVIIYGNARITGDTYINGALYFSKEHYLNNLIDRSTGAELGVYCSSQLNTQGKLCVGNVSYDNYMFNVTGDGYISGNLVVNGTNLIAKIQELESRIAKLEAKI